MRLIQQLRPPRGGAEGEEGEDDGLDDVIQRLMAHIQPVQATDDTPSPQAALNEQMYQAARAGDLVEVRKAVESGMFCNFSQLCSIRKFLKSIF
jgi:hypothetical protein